MQWTQFFRVTRRVRAADHNEFHRYLLGLNAQRTLVVGGILLAFALFWLGLNLAGVDDGPLLVYATFLVTLAIGVGLMAIYWPFDDTGVLGRTGEALILATAIAWMFFAVYQQAHVSHGLVEFVIGTLALAMLRTGPLSRAALLFTGLAIAYGVVLWMRDLISLYAINNGVLFCLFAFVLATGNYNSRILEFRNRKMVQQLNRQNQQLSTLAMQDSLTGLPNRRYLDQLLEKHWSDEVLRKRPLALVLMDIDYFKQFNDKHGHPAGDRCLQAVAEQLRAAVRHEATCARLGGEEFSIVLPDTRLESATEIAERLRRAMVETTGITASFGVAEATPCRQSSESFYIDADQALYRAKRGGRNRVIAAS